MIVTQPTTPTSTPAPPPSQLTLDPGIVQTQTLAIDGSSVWVTGDAPQNRAATLEQIDTRTGDVLHKITLGDNLPFQIVVGDGAVWVASQQNEDSAHITKVDPATGKITAVIETTGDANVAITRDAVWVDENQGTLLRLDPDTNKVLATITLPGGGYSAHFITAGPLGIFLANPYDGTVLRVDPATNTFTQIADVGTYAGEIVELGDSLWINSYGALVELNPTTGAVVRTLPRSGLRDLASDGRSLWASTDTSHVFRIDPASGAATSVQLPMGVRFAIELAADPATGAVWAASDPLPVGDAEPQRLLRLAP